MRVSQVLSYALLSTTVSAWSLQELRDNKAVQGVEGMFRRADSSDTTCKLACVHLVEDIRMSS